MFSKNSYGKLFTEKENYNQGRVGLSQKKHIKISKNREKV